MNTYLDLNLELLSFYAIDFVIAIALLAAIRWLSSRIGNVSSIEELSKHDNPAFGISLAGTLIAISIMLMGVVSGDIGANRQEEFVMMISYGALGILLMWATRIIFDRIALPSISIHNEVMKGNVAAGIADAGNLIATAIIIKAAMSWVEGSSMQVLFAILGGYLLSQLLLLLATAYRSRVYARRHPGESIHDAIEKGNTALALRFSGYRIGIALAVTAASGLVVFSPDHVLLRALIWGGMALIMFILLTLVSILMRKAILPGIDVAEEVDQQHNIAIGAVEAAVYLAVGFLLTGLFG